MNKLTRLLEKGLFPSQLPPCFTGKAFAAYCEANSLPQVPKGPQNNTTSEKFSVARAGHFRRPTVIINPHQYYFLANAITDNWTTISSFLSASTISKSVPDFIPNGNRAISILATRELSEHKLKISTGYKYVLQTDISQFFPTIYTHSVPWALYGKNLVKNKLSKIPGASHPKLGDDLDLFTRRLQANQTIGLPIGPDSSHILAEIIGVAMDILLCNELPDLVGYRYVDDYTFFFNKLEEAENCLATLTRVLSLFELNINATKTRIVHLSELTSDYWTHELKSFSISSKLKKQKRDILHFFDVALLIARNNTDENVMKFALKKISAKLILEKNWPVFEANLLRVALLHPNSIIDVAHILYTYKHYDYPIDVLAVARTIYAIIRDHGPLGHHSEVAWALWIAGILEIKIPEDVADIVFDLGSSPSLILLLYLNRKGLCEKLNNKKLAEKSDKNGVYGDMWLAVYEARFHKYFTPTINPLSGTFFESLEKAGVSFFDFTRRPKPLFKIRNKWKAGNLLNWDSYDEDDVEFEDIPDDYSEGIFEEDDEDEADTDEDEDEDEDEDDDDDDDDDDQDKLSHRKETFKDDWDDDDNPY